MDLCWILAHLPEVLGIIGFQFRHTGLQNTIDLCAQIFKCYPLLHYRFCGGFLRKLPQVGANTLLHMLKLIPLTRQGYAAG